MPVVTNFHLEMFLAGIISLVIFLLAYAVGIMLITIQCFKFLPSSPYFKPRVSEFPILYQLN